MSKFAEVPSVGNRSFRTQVDLYSVDLGTVNPVLNPPGGLFISTPFEGGVLDRDGEPIWEERGGGLFNLEKTMVSVLHKELKYKVEKLKYKKF